MADRHLSRERDVHGPENVVATIVRRPRTARRRSGTSWRPSSSFPVTYAFGNFAAPWYYGVNQQIVAGFALAGTAAGLTMLGVGTAYYVLPKATGQPIYSERVALVGFWSFVFAAPWIGQIQAIFGPGQDYLETAAITFAGWLLIPALCVFVNFWGTLRNAWDPKAISEPAVKFVVGGFSLFLLFATIQIRRRVAAIDAGRSWGSRRGGSPPRRRSPAGSASSWSRSSITSSRR